MSCIVAIEENNKVYMAGDTLGSSDDYKVSLLNSKVFLVGEYAIGFTGSYRIGDLLRDGWSPPEMDSTMTIREHMVRVFIPSMRALFKENGVDIKAMDQSDSTGESTFLIGFKGTLFIIDTDYSVQQPRSKYTAEGAGFKFALGSLFGTELMANPVDRLDLALKATAEYSQSVAPPFTFIEI